MTCCRDRAFSQIKDKHLLRFGVPEELIGLCEASDSDAELEAGESRLPQEAYEALFMLASGYSLDEVFREMEKPEEEVPVDQKDFVAALQNEDSKAAVLRGRRGEGPGRGPECSARPMAHLPPSEAAHDLYRCKRTDPVRVLGGAGTGKTVVAMHRARYLAEEVFNKKEDRILFTTFTRNLATDIQENLRKLCSVDALSRIDVVNLDAWVANFLRGQGYRHQVGI